MKKVIILITMLMILPMVLAATDTNDADEVFKINTFVEYKKACFNNGTYCSDSALCNFTIFNPDKTLLAENLEATNNGAYHNVTFYVEQNGMHQIDMVCDDDGNKGAGTFWMQVTGNGFNDSVWFYVMIIIFSFGVMVLGFYLSDPPIVILGSFGLYFLGIYILRFGIVGFKDLTTTWAAGLVILGLAFYISGKSAFELVEGYK